MKKKNTSKLESQPLTTMNPLFENCSGINTDGSLCKLDFLLNISQVMMYTGQLDIIVAIPLTEAFLMTVPWSGLDDYKIAKRMVWRINPEDREVAGYVRQVGKFYQV